MTPLDRLKRAWPLVFLVSPVVLLFPHLRPHHAPGQDHGGLYAAAQVADWLVNGGLGQASATVPAELWWPQTPALALWAGVLAPLSTLELGLGLGTLLALVLAGLGPCVLVRARRPGQPVGTPLYAAVAVGLLVQTSVPMLRGVATGELGPLAIGPVCLALAARRRHSAGMWALLAGAWSVPAALVLAGLGLWHRRPMLALGVLMALPAWLLPSTLVPGGAASMPPRDPHGLSYVADNLAVLPLPTDELSALAIDPVSIPLDPSSVPGGLALWLALLLGLVLGRRAPALLGLVGLGLYLWLFGPVPAPELAGALPNDLVRTLDRWLPAMNPARTAAAWLVLPVLGLPLALRGGVRWPWLVGVLLGVQLVAEAPLHRVSGGAVLPDGLESQLSGLPPGDVWVLPGPLAQGGQAAPDAAVLLRRALRRGRRLHLGQPDPGLALWAAHLGWLIDRPVPTASAESVWNTRAEDPVAAARVGGIAGIAVHRASLSQGEWARLEGWLVARVGTAIWTEGDWAVFGMQPLGAGEAGP